MTDRAEDAAPDPTDWIGRTETASEMITTTSVYRMSRTLDRDDPAPKAGDPLPPCWHWLYFAPAVLPADIGPDGHPAKGGFLPPIAYPRRMWAGSRISFLKPLRVGETASRRSEIANVTFKEGRTGKLAFVTVKHTFGGAEDGVVDDPAIIEEQDIVYREPPAGANTAPPPQALPGPPAFEREINADPVMLFRYSALTFNGHRIHYDHPYVTEVEGYPGLIVHGPLIATLLVDLVRRSVADADIATFSFRGLRPTFDTGRFKVQGFRDGDVCTLWSLDNGGHLAMSARVGLRS